MNIEELPKPKTEELSDDQKENLFTSIVLGKDVTETIQTSKGEFKVKFPRIQDTTLIGRMTATKLGGVPVESYDYKTYALIKQVATLDVVVLSGPAWYENAKKEKGFTWSMCPSESFVQEVYAKAYDFRQKVQEQLEPSKEKTDRGLDSDKNDNVPSEPGLFEGLSS